jgi:hypothetical protein
MHTASPLQLLWMSHSVHCTAVDSVLRLQFGLDTIYYAHTPLLGYIAKPGQSDNRPGCTTTPATTTPGNATESGKGRLAAANRPCQQCKIVWVTQRNLHTNCCIRLEGS